MEGTSTIDEATPILKMPKETLVQIFDYIDPEEDWGRVAMALTCKKFAVVSKLTKVIKTAVNTGKGKLDLIPSGKKFCSGCGHVRSLSRGFWEINGRLLEAQWDTLPLGETHIPWKPRYDHMIKVSYLLPTKVSSDTYSDIAAELEGRSQQCRVSVPRPSLLGSPAEMGGMAVFNLERQV